MNNPYPPGYEPKNETPDPSNPPWTFEHQIRVLRESCRTKDRTIADLSAAERHLANEVQDRQKKVDYYRKRCDGLLKYVRRVFSKASR